MASGIGTNVSVVPGDPLRIGMLFFYTLSFELYVLLIKTEKAQWRKQV